MFHDNQAYVIGGLIQETDTDVERKLPWLGDLKHFGHLFQRAEVVKRRSVVIVALLPRVMPFDPVTNDNLLLETDQAMAPLLYGPLLEYPRPWEAQLPHVVKNPKLLRLPTVRGIGCFQGEGSGSSQKALEPIGAFDSTTRTMEVPREIGPPVVVTSRRPDSGGAIGLPRMTRLPPTIATQPVGSRYTATPTRTAPR